MAFKLTAKQEECMDLLGKGYRHTLFYGGSRSGKTFLIIRAIIVRALKARGSRHVILRYRFNHIKASIVNDTFPKVMRLCFPEVPYKLDRQDYFVKFEHNNSEIWFGGLDNKERTEKILGNEYSTIFFNECSQLSYSSITLALTRLAQNIRKLKNRVFYDCNPPGKSHWTYKYFIDGVDPKDPDRKIKENTVCSMLVNPKDNKENLPSDYIDEVLEGLPERERARFLLGLWAEGIEGAVYDREIEIAEQEKRFTEVPFNPKYPVFVTFDIGTSDSTSMWFHQFIDNWINCIDYYENNKYGFPHYVDIMREKARKNGYTYNKLFFPHDAMNKDWSTGKTKRETALEYGFDVDIIPKLRLHDSIHAARLEFKNVKFDKAKCDYGIECLRNHRYEYDDNKSIEKEKPEHDWTSHGSDAFRYMCTAHNLRLAKPIPLKNQIKKSDLTFSSIMSKIKNNRQRKEKWNI